jgi:hypothetical protein
LSGDLLHHAFPGEIDESNFARDGGFSDRFRREFSPLLRRRRLDNGNFLRSHSAVAIVGSLVAAVLEPLSVAG